MPAQGLTGKAGSLTIGGNTIAITKCSSKLNVEFADSTDSSNFNSGTNEISKAQLSGDQQIEFSIEGYYDLASTATDIINIAKLPSTGPFAAVFKLNASTTYFNGNVDLTDVETSVEVPGATMVSFTCNAKSNGNYTLI